MKLLNGVALVTGAGSGIGRAIAIRCAETGCRAITIADVNVGGLEELLQSLKRVASETEVLKIVTDAADAGSVAETVSRTIASFGRLDYAFNVAGISVKARVAAAKYPMKEYDEIQAINARGLLLCVQAEIQAMVQQSNLVTMDGYCAPPRAQKGSIVNIASTCSFSVIPDMLPYVTSKHAVEGITKAAAVDHARERIRINAVCPGLVETAMIARRRTQIQNKMHEGTDPELDSSDSWTPANMYSTPMGRLAQAEEVADTCIFLASSMSSHMTAASVVVDGGRSAAY